MCRCSRSGPSAECEVISIPDSDASNSDSEEDYVCGAADDELARAEAHHHPDQAPSSIQDNQMPFNVLLTCYTLFERDSVDQQADRSFFKKWRWSHLLLDEAHAVKNASAMRTRRLTRYMAELCSTALEAAQVLSTLHILCSAVSTQQQHASHCCNPPQASTGPRSQTLLCFWTVCLGMDCGSCSKCCCCSVPHGIACCGDEHG